MLPFHFLGRQNRQGDWVSKRASAPGVREKPGGVGRGWPAIQSKTSTWSVIIFKNMWSQRAVNLNLQYGHVILVSGHLVLRGINWPKCLTSKKYALSQGCMSQSTYWLEYGCHLVRLHHHCCWAYMPTSHDHPEKINSCISFSFLYK